MGPSFDSEKKTKQRTCVFTWLSYVLNEAENLCFYIALLRLDFFFYLTSSRHSVARPQMLTLPPRRKLGSKERSGGDDVTTAFHKALAMKESKIKGNFLVVNAV